MTNDVPPEQELRLPAIAGPAERNLALRISPGAERALRAGHPWLYADAIREQSHEGQPGDLAVIFDRHRRFLAIGLYDPLSPIRVRILQAGKPAPINRDWFKQKIAAAAERRSPLEKRRDTTGYRLLHGENDGMPGLVIDRYDSTYVLKLYTAAWLPHLPNVLPVLLDVVPMRRLVLRLGRVVAEQDQFLEGLQGGQVLLGPPLQGPVRFRENNIRFAADVTSGQKTGFFFDHRENRQRVEALASGTTMLNVFAYTGAFSLYAARGGAQLILSLDLSQPALAAAMQNFQLNHSHPTIAEAEHEVLVGDAFQSLMELRRARREFDLIVVDPPSFARNRAELEGALGAYRKLVRRSLRLLRPGGTLVMASCTARLTAERFFETVHQAANSLERPLQEIERTFQPLDHPIGFPEGAYLKCLFAVAP